MNPAGVVRIIPIRAQATPALLLDASVEYNPA